MHPVISAPKQMLVSLSRDELTALAKCVERDLAGEAPSLDREILETLRQDIRKSLEAPVAGSTEVFEAWRDGLSIQLKAVSAFGDPADLSAGEVKEKLLPLIDEAERLIG